MSGVSAAASFHMTSRLEICVGLHFGLGNSEVGEVLASVSLCRRAKD